jgi:hypothetical protein
VQGDNLTILLFFLASAIAFGTTAVSLAGWNNKVIVWIFLGLCGLSVACSFGWTIPAAKPAIAAIADSPSSWFVLFILMICAFVVTRRNLSVANRTSPATIEIAAAGGVPAPHTKVRFFRSDDAWKAGIALSQRGERVDILIELSAYSQGIGMGQTWLTRRRWPLGLFEKMPMGVETIIELFSVEKPSQFSPPRWVWRIAPNAASPNALEVARTMTRAQLILQTEDGREEYFPFLVMFGNELQMPVFIAHKWFEFAKRWEAGPGA